MSGYVATARIVHGTPRLVHAGAVDRSLEAALAAAPIEDLIVEADPPEPDAWARIAEVTTAARERWSQLTFYLFDPNSWR
jgi:hypothetical protein